MFDCGRIGVTVTYSSPSSARKGFVPGPSLSERAKTRPEIELLEVVVAVVTARVR